MEFDSIYLCVEEGHICAGSPPLGGTGTCVVTTYKVPYNLIFFPNPHFFLNLDFPHEISIYFSQNTITLLHEVERKLYSLDQFYRQSNHK